MGIQTGNRPCEPRTAWKPSLPAMRIVSAFPRMGGPGATPAVRTAWLAAVLYFTGVRPVSAAAFDGTPQERAAAIQAAGYAQDASAVHALSLAALDRDLVVAYAAAEALGAVGTEAAADALLKAWEVDSPAVLANGLLRCAEVRREAKDATRARALYAACAAKGTETQKAVTERTGVTADAAGKVKVEFKTLRDHALVSGVELLEMGNSRQSAGAVGSQTTVNGGRRAEDSQVAAVPRPIGKPGQLDVLILAGANNHNWQETTAALREVFASMPTFAVTVAESPWDMKRADLDGYELVFSNWNTWAKEKREWTPEMKAGFIAWVKKGGGFFVLHAGGSLYYDWEEYQQLTGGSWEKGTFHPHMQAFTVNIANKEHPVTRGLADFEIFDEPWQRVANRNPARQVLLTAVIGKENKGSGETEPFAWTTRTGEGRCFTLMLGHDARAITNAGCRALILRGSEWAATGKVK